MRKLFYTLAVLIPLVALVCAAGFGFFGHTNGARAAASCTTTSFTQDGIPNLTAAMVVTASGTINGIVNANGCDMGIYINSGLTVTINNAEVYGSRVDGIVNDGSTVTVSNSRIHDIGDSPLDGVQYGYGIYYTATHHSKGKITKNIIWNYQKNGIVVRGTGSNATISYNTVLGQGPVNYIAQNGIEVGEGANGTITYNTVQGNSYTGTSGGAASGGILIYGGSCYGAALSIGVHVTNNIVVGNDIGVFISDLDGTTCIPTLTPTRIVTNKNTISNDTTNNTGGTNLEGQCCGYQAGVSDQGDGDQITNNGICGIGYTPAATPPYYYAIDTTATNNPSVSGNFSCLDGSPVSAALTRGTGAQSWHKNHPVARI